MRNIGVDLHKDNFVVNFLNSKGKTEFITYRFEEMGVFKKRLRKTDVIGVEATSNTRFFVNQVKHKVSKIIVINPQKFKVISESINKTDLNDVETIAFYLSKGLLPEARLKEQHLSELESLISTRDKLVKTRTVLKNKIHNILLGQGILTKKKQFSSKKGLEKILDHKNLSEIARFELELIVNEISHLNSVIKNTNDKLIEKGKQLPGFENLVSIKGIGALSATILLSIIGNINDFESKKKLSAYFGIVPKVNNSNKTIRHGRITKRGSKIGRTTLIQCVLIAKRYSPYLRDFHKKIKAAKGSGKANIAAAKKFLGIIYNTLKEDWVFEDFPNFVLKS